MGARTDTRTKMLVSAIELLRERGAAAVTVDAVLSHSGTPRGSVYHHFPGGRDQILAEALQIAGDTIGVFIEQASTIDPHTALDRMAAFWSASLTDSDFRAGCPVVSVAVGASPGEEPLRDTAADLLDRWHRSLRAALTDVGVPTERARRLAHLTVATLEGAVILCRARRSVEPLDDATAELHLLLDTVVPAG
ncbi:TetR/AcrR family transcriptional regulator [Mycolicibacillus koreensis]|nr:TetR/AcrR family transcriptional regulator [Mycolicibacillus koreensis]BBY55191.1 TetR family transcriptional regulator [Mycolicibacillus koreensis]